MFAKLKKGSAKQQEQVKLPASLNKKERQQIAKIVETARRDDGTPRTAQQSILKCAHCRRTLVRSHSTAGYYYYSCTKSRHEKDRNCPKGKLFTEPEIEKIVFNAIKQMLQICEERRKQQVSLVQTRTERIASCVATIKKLQQQQERYKQEKLRAYENYSAEVITKEAYLRQRTEVDAKLETIKDDLSKQQGLLDALERQSFNGESYGTDLYAAYAGATELTAELVKAFIKEIFVSSPDSIEIIWNFRDVFQAVADTGKD